MKKNNSISARFLWVFLLLAIHSLGVKAVMIPPVVVTDDPDELKITWDGVGVNDTSLDDDFLVAPVLVHWFLPSAHLAYPTGRWIGVLTPNHVTDLHIGEAGGGDPAKLAIEFGFAPDKFEGEDADSPDHDGHLDIYKLTYSWNFRTDTLNVVLEGRHPLPLPESGAGSLPIALAALIACSLCLRYSSKTSLPLTHT